MVFQHLHYLSCSFCIKPARLAKFVHGCSQLLDEGCLSWSTNMGDKTPAGQTDFSHHHHHHHHHLEGCISGSTNMRDKTPVGQTDFSHHHHHHHHHHHEGCLSWPTNMRDKTPAGKTDFNQLVEEESFPIFRTKQKLS